MNNIISSTQLNELGDKLIEVIKSNHDFFHTLRVIVPDNKMEEWFKAYWLRHEDGVLANISFETIDKALLSLIYTDHYYHLIKKDYLKALIIKHLVMNPRIYEKETKIKQYLEDNDSIKLYDLASNLTNLFLAYDEDNLDITGWQKDLYNKVMEDASHFNTKDEEKNINYLARLGSLKYIYDQNNKFIDNQDSLYFWGFITFTPIEERIINDYAEKHDITIYKLEESNQLLSNFKITQAPSKLREVEFVHSQICELLKNKDVNYSDICVLAPNMSTYENYVARVFNQDNIHFPNIPYSFNDSQKKETDVSLILTLLFEIAQKDYFTRVDFSDLVHNKTVQTIRGITDEEATEWCRDLVQMNVFGHDDWDYAKKRLLLSKVTDNGAISECKIEINGEDHVPFSSIGLNDEDMIKLIQLIDDVISFKTFYKNIKLINNDTIIQLQSECDKWCSIKNEGGYETNLYYKSVTNLLNIWIQFEISQNTISLNTLLYHILDVSRVHSYNVGEYFTQGITFADLSNTAIISVPYIFIMGMNSEAWPRYYLKSELDLRKEKDDNQDNIAFNIQTHNATGQVYLSYVAKDLKTDEDYYPSPCLTHLKKDLIEKNSLSEEEYKQNYIKTIGLDENRSWSQLFTQKEYKDKDYNEALLNKVTIQNQPSNANHEWTHEWVKSLTAKNLADYLEEPLKYKAGVLFGHDDVVDEEMQVKYADFTMSPLDQALILKNVAPLVITETLDETNYEEWSLIHFLPRLNETIETSSYAKTLNQAKEIKEFAESISGERQIGTLTDLVIYNETIKNNWVLSCGQNFVRIIDDNKIRSYILIKKISAKTNTYANLKELLLLYVITLMDIYSLNNTEKYDINIFRSQKVKTSYTLTSQEAGRYLNAIYEAINDYQDNKFVYIDDLSKKSETLRDLIKAHFTGDYGAWSYFPDSKMFDKEIQLGYEENNFKEIYLKTLKQHLTLIEPLLNDELKDKFKKTWLEEEKK